MNEPYDEVIQARIERAKELLGSVRNAAMATVNDDGAPHNTPFYFIHDEKLERIYWISYPAALHCHNALRTGLIFVVLYGSNKGGGLYIKANGSHVLQGAELETALEIHNALRAKENQAPVDLSHYTGDSSQRMYSATPTNFYVNNSERNEAGVVIRDYRHEISRSDLTP